MEKRKRPLRSPKLPRNGRLKTAVCNVSAPQNCCKSCRRYCGIAHQGDETLICALVNRAWEAFGRRHLPLLVRVPSGKGAAIQAQLRTWAQRLAPAEEVDVQELHTLPEGCCEVVSPLGRMRLSLETQLEAFAKAFETALEQEEEAP